MNAFLSAVLLIAVTVLPAAEKTSKASRKAAQDATTQVAVSVFREPGFAVSAAEIQLALAPDNTSGAKAKKLKVTSNARGEYVFHVSPEAARYVVTASAKGLKTQEKTVEVRGEARVDVNFVLEQESKESGDR